MRTIEQLVDSVQREARRAAFPIDAAAYKRAGKDPTRPILFAGSLEAPICFFGRDLGKDEVAEGEPLIGSGGRLVRAGIYGALHGTAPPKSDRRLDSVLEHALLTNTVPYKPPGNKAYATSIKERFRPFLEEFLGTHWTGDRIVTLGTEAFQWFAPYGNPDAFETFWRTEDRYQAEIECVLATTDGHSFPPKPLILMPLPHPSPLNQKWYKRFPELLAARLATLSNARA